MTDYERYSQLPLPPEGSGFKLKDVDTIAVPHPFMITPTHVAYASKHGGVLDEHNITYSGGRCGMKNCQLKFSEHKSQVTASIEVPQNRDLNAVEGLHAYLLSIKDKAVELGIEGFAFPVKKGEKR